MLVHCHSEERLVPPPRLAQNVAWCARSVEPIVGRARSERFSIRLDMFVHRARLFDIVPILQIPGRSGQQVAGFGRRRPRFGELARLRECRSRRVQTRPKLGRIWPDLAWSWPHLCFSSMGERMRTRHARLDSASHGSSTSRPASTERASSAPASWRAMEEE